MMYNEPMRNYKEENHLRRKLFACLFAALLALALAVPAFAEPEAQTASDETSQGMTEVLAIDPRMPGEDLTEEGTFAILAYTEPTTIGIVPIEGETVPEAMLLAADGAAGEGLFSQRNLTFAALALSAAAAVLSIAALARTRKKTAPNATGNYQKYF